MNIIAPTPATSIRTGDAFSSLNGEAEALVEEYTATRKRARVAPLFKEKEVAKSKLAKLLRQRDILVIEVAKSPLIPAQKREISDKLSSMVE